MTKAILIGNYGITNLGDEAILSAILSSHPKFKFTVFSHSPQDTKLTHNVNSTYPLPFGLRSFLRGNFIKSFRNLKKTDIVIIGGGGLFTDEKFRAILIWSWHFIWAKLFHKPVYIYANSIGPLKTKLGKFIVKKILQKADGITVRDSLSGKLLKELDIKNFKITADPAFLIESKNKQKKRQKKVAISLRHWISNEEKYISVIKETIQELETEGYQVLLIPMQIRQDDDTKILSQVASEKSIIVSPKDLEELISILSKCEFSIGMRLHFLIASALAHTPFITLSYSNKTTALTEELKQKKYLLRIEDISFEKIQELIQMLKTEHTVIIEKLKTEVLLEKEKAAKNILIFQKLS